MTTAAVIIGIIALIVISTSSVLIAVAVFKALSDVFPTLDRAHERWVKQTERLLDRLASRNWEEYVVMREVDTDDVGGFYAPGEQDQENHDSPKDVQLNWGSLRRPLIDADDDNEERILNEDFDDEGEPVRRIPR